MQCVYLLQEIDFDDISPTGLYKIGQTSQDVEARKRQYQAGNARRVDTLHTIQVNDAQAVETDLHRQLAAYRAHHGGGDEWFFFADEDLDYLINFINEYDETPINVIPNYSTEYSHEASYGPYSYNGDFSDKLSGLGIGLLICLGLIGLIFVGVRLSQSSQPRLARIEVPISTGKDSANLRSVPKDGDEFIIGQLRNGEQMKVYEASFDGKWQRVQSFDGRSGWVAKNFVR